MDTLIRSHPSANITSTGYAKNTGAENTYPPTVKAFVPLLLSFTAGTGGVMTAHSTEILAQWLYTPQIHVEPSVQKQVDTRSPAEHVANIRDVFGINMSDLASLLGITRPTAYAWLEGQEPKPEAILRIQRLSHTADEVKQMNISRLDKLIHRPILDGYSLLERLKSDEDLSEALAKLKAIAEKEKQTRRESKASGKHLRSLDDALSDISAPIEWSE